MNNHTNNMHGISLKSYIIFQEAPHGKLNSRRICLPQLDSSENTEKAQRKHRENTEKTQRKHRENKEKTQRKHRVMRNKIVTYQIGIST